MTPEQYNYRQLCERRRNMTPAEIFDEMSPALRDLVVKWVKEDEREVAALRVGEG